MMFCKKIAVSALLLLVAQSTALICPHKTIEYRNGKVFSEDAGLIECSNSSTVCMYHSSTTFFLNGTENPIMFEGVHCSAGGFLEANNNTAEFSNDLQHNFCSAKNKSSTYIFVDDSSRRVEYRINAARCCSTDNCTISEYTNLGGGYERDSLFSVPAAIYKKVTGLLSTFTNKIFS